MLNKHSVAFWVILPLLLGAWILPHIELKDSFPKADQALEEAPAEIWLEFSVAPDTATSAFSVRGPDGGIKLGAVRWDEEDEPNVLRAEVEGEMSPGDYMISWTAAPIGDHGGRGRINFSVAGQR